MAKDSPRARMVEALGRVAAELDASGHSAYAGRIRRAAHEVAAATNDRSALRTVVCAAIDAVLASEVTLNGELIQVLADMADPPLYAGRLGPRELSRALAVMVAMPDSPDRAVLGGEVDTLAAVIDDDPAPRATLVLQEAAVLAQEVGAEHLRSVVLQLQAEHDQQERRTLLDQEQAKGKRDTFEWSTALKWLAAVVVAVGILASLANALGSLKSGALALLEEWD